MKSILSVTGPQGICIAAFAWWWGENSERVMARVNEWLERVGPTALMDRNEHRIGDAVLAANREISEWLFLDLAHTPGVSDMIAHAAACWNRSSEDDKQRIGLLREFVIHQLGAEIGISIKKTDWFRNHWKAIRTEKRNVKKVKQVLES